MQFRSSVFVKSERLGVCLEADGQEPTGNERVKTGWEKGQMTDRGIYDEEENSARDQRGGLV